MRTATIHTNLRCNLACGFCNSRAAENEPLRHGDAAIRGHIRQALDAGVTELVFSGGEPLLADDLEGWIAAGATNTRVVVESNGTLLAVPGRARALAAAGLDAVRVGINTWGEAADQLGRLPGAWRWQLRGLAAAHEAGLAIEVSVALGATNLNRAAALPAQILAAAPGVQLLLLRIISEAPDEHLASWPALAQGAVALAEACRAVELPLRADPRHALPWCALPRRRRYPELLAPPRASSDPGQGRIEACATCAVSERCPGLPRAHLARFGDAGLVAIPERHSRLIQSLSDTRAERAAREVRADQWFGDCQGELQLERVLRPVLHCNQACAFCFVDRELAPPTPARIREEIELAAREGVALLALSGGEPTLDPHLREHIAMARQLGLRVRLQTNAMRCAEPGYAASLAAAGLGEAFVSLHAADGSRSDAITSAPDTHGRTLAGIDALVAAAVQVQVNCVITGGNRDALRELPALIARRWPGAVALNLSWAHASSELVPLSSDITPGLADLRDEIGATVAACARFGVTFRGLDGQCGLPLCMPDPDWLALERLPRLPRRDPPPGFVKIDGCLTCAWDARCVGLRQGYAQLHGTGELRPINAVASSPGDGSA